MKRQPVTNPVQTFCANFASHLDMSDSSELRWKRDVHWPEKMESSISLKISRYTLEVLQNVLDESKEHKLLAREVLKFYSPSPIEKFCDCNLVAKALIDSNLSDKPQTELAAEIADNVKDWLNLAEERARKLLPDENVGITGMITNGYGVFWGKAEDGRILPV